jgi:hypothetical protein
MGIAQATVANGVLWSVLYSKTAKIMKDKKSDIMSSVIISAVACHSYRYKMETWMAKAYNTQGEKRNSHSSLVGTRAARHYLHNTGVDGRTVPKLVSKK